ncbi:hypothetical protein L3X38_004813 [Prunus dulcis]|uniref:Uncharacterized protein n=1 Tax=Prunus dulcis TaxID=3755 RepID=A0AAD4ZPH0_PRUDU|nr:hypothetical protein L3X38_004813 [Prunus dulcis]
MSDWGPVFVAVVLFVLLSPGLLFQLPGRHGCVEFGGFQTSGAAIMLLCFCGENGTPRKQEENVTNFVLTRTESEE